MRSCLALLMFLAVMIASAQAMSNDVYQGHWQQVASNAGECDECRISIKRDGEGFKVVSSNGWSAMVMPNHLHGESFALGEGAWDDGAGGIYGGKPFLILLKATGRELHMKMSVPRADGAARVVRAIFEKSNPEATDGV